MLDVVTFLAKRPKVVERVGGPAEVKRPDVVNLERLCQSASFATMRGPFDYRAASGLPSSSI